MLINENWNSCWRACKQRPLRSPHKYQWSQSHSSLVKRDDCLRRQRAHWGENSNMTSKTELDTGGGWSLEAMLHFALWPTLSWKQLTSCFTKFTAVTIQTWSIILYYVWESLVKLIKIDTYRMWVEVIDCGSRANFSCAWLWNRWVRLVWIQHHMIWKSDNKQCQYTFSVLNCECVIFKPISKTLLAAYGIVYLL